MGPAVGHHAVCIGFQDWLSDSARSVKKGRPFSEKKATIVGVSPPGLAMGSRVRGLTPNGTDFSNPKRQRGRGKEAFSYDSLADASGDWPKVSAIGLTPPGPSPTSHHSSLMQGMDFPILQLHEPGMRQRHLDLNF